jgi:hypothetical protein
MPAGVSAGYSFTSTSSEAAILALPEGAARQNLRNLTKFRYVTRSRIHCAGTSLLTVHWVGKPPMALFTLSPDATNLQHGELPLFQALLDQVLCLLRPLLPR